MLFAKVQCGLKYASWRQQFYLRSTGSKVFRRVIAPATFPQVGLPNNQPMLWTPRDRDFASLNRPASRQNIFCCSGFGSAPRVAASTLLSAGAHIAAIRYAAGSVNTGLDVGLRSALRAVRPATFL